HLAPAIVAVYNRYFTPAGNTAPAGTGQGFSELMSLNVAVVMDPIAAINFKKDTTLAMLLAAQARDWNLHYIEMDGLYLDGSEPMALMHSLAVRPDPNDWFTLGTAANRSLAEMDVVLMRKDPPFDNEYIYATY